MPSLVGWHKILYLWDLSHWSLYLLKPWLLYLTMYCQKSQTRLNVGKHYCKGSLRCQTYFSLPSCLFPVFSWWSGSIIPPQMVWLLSFSGGLVEWGSWEKEVAWNIMRSSECPLVEVFTIWKPGILSNPGNSVSGMMRKNSPSRFLEVSINGTICIFTFLWFLYPCILP